MWGHICAGVAHLASLGALRTLSLRECRNVTGAGFAAFAAVSHPLQSLNLCGCTAFSQQGALASNKLSSSMGQVTAEVHDRAGV